MIRALFAHAQTKRAGRRGSERANLGALSPVVVLGGEPCAVLGKRGDLGEAGDAMGITMGPHGKRGLGRVRDPLSLNGTGRCGDTPPQEGRPASRRRTRNRASCVGCVHDR